MLPPITYPSKRTCRVSTLHTGPTQAFWTNLASPHRQVVIFQLRAHPAISSTGILVVAGSTTTNPPCVRLHIPQATSNYLELPQPHPISSPARWTVDVNSNKHSQLQHQHQYQHRHRHRHRHRQTRPACHEAFLSSACSLPPRARARARAQVCLYGQRVKEPPPCGPSTGAPRWRTSTTS